MSETFFLYLLGLIFSFVLGIYGLHLLNKVVLTNKLLVSEQKLRARIATFERNYSDIRADSGGFISGGLGDMGVDGIMDALGVPAIFKPIAKGFIDKITQNPEMLQGILKKVGVDINIPSKETNTITQV